MIVVPCPWCGKEGYDRAYWDGQTSRHIDCGKDVAYTLRNRIRWWWHRMRSAGDH